jgi:hypothetical protein
MEDIVKYICHCCGRLCFAFLICHAFKSYIEVFLEGIKLYELQKSFANVQVLWKEY